MFANTPRGEQASAIIYSIVETAKEISLNPFLYLTYLFEKPPSWQTYRILKQLTSCFRGKRRFP
jgi:hypothetical protein